MPDPDTLELQLTPERAAYLAPKLKVVLRDAASLEPFAPANVEPAAISPWVVEEDRDAE